MKIDRSNYEIWLIDWLDGNLSEFQKRDIEHFLDENPDLRTEFNELGNKIVEAPPRYYPNKELLKKTTGELPDNQFELFCLAYIEGDMTSSEQSEFLEMIKSDTEKIKTFNLLKKIQLKPEEITYQNKNKLLKRTLRQQVIRLSVIGLSAAAAAVFIVVSYTGNHTELPVLNNNIAQVFNPDTTKNSLQINQEVSESPVAVIKKNFTPAEAAVPVSGEMKPDESQFLPEEEKVTIPDSEIENRIIAEPVLKKITYTTQIKLKVDISNSLIASNTHIEAPENEVEQSRLGKFIATTFRERILKEDVVPDTPLRGYEIAEAGVTGLNKLLGWEMSLNENSNEEGDPSSVYFSSRILKFNAPVKKSSSFE